MVEGYDGLEGETIALAKLILPPTKGKAPCPPQPPLHMVVGGRLFIQAQPDTMTL